MVRRKEHRRRAFARRDHVNRLTDQSSDPPGRDAGCYDGARYPAIPLPPHLPVAHRWRAPLGSDDHAGPFPSWSYAPRELGATRNALSPRLRSLRDVLLILVLPFRAHLVFTYIALQMFDSKAELQIHTQVHMREAKPYKCSHCPKSFANSSYLSQHMRIHLGIKPFGPCQYCGRKFTQLSHLQQHLRTHTGEKPYKCRYPGCEKAFSQLSNLQSHSRCHQTDKPYKCNSCYKCFCDEQSLLDHIPKHKESKHLKVHICPYCGKSYTQAAYLSKHMTKHADKKPVKPVAGAEQHLWVRENSLCAVPSILESCSDQASASALPFNSFPAHNHMMQPQTCAYTPTGIASSMAAAGMTPDPSAFTRLAGLNPLSRTFAAASSRAPYFAYENFKSPAHPNALSHPNYSAPYNHLIRLDDIRNYAGQAAAASAEHLSMLVKRDPREAVYN
uniref:C2H2-type domain-containing protein n=1 Tax=Trichuris muris TaxID=70415 RepID=A0A5S6QC77_TRIMR